MRPTHRGLGIVAMCAIATLAAPLLLTAQATPTTEGSLDARWDTDGLRAFHVTADGFDMARAAIVQPDGRTVIVGHTGGPSVVACVTVRLKRDGSNDTTFHATGQRLDSIGSACNLNAVALQPDGDIVAVGSTTFGTYYDGVVIRIRPDGKLDKSFGTKGVALLPGGDSDATLWSVGLTATGKIVVAGSTNGPANLYYAARLTAAGALDKKFANHGVFTHIIGDSSAAVAALAIQPDGKIVLAGNSPLTGAQGFGLVRLKPGGALDPSFDGDGIARIQFGTGSAVPHAMVLTPTGNIVVGGDLSGVHSEYAMAEVDHTGAPVDGFGTHGQVIQQVGDGDATITAMALQPDGKLILSGDTVAGTEPLIGVARYLPNGTPDPSFDGDGFYAPASDAELFGFGMALGPDGTIVAVGYGYESPDPYLVATFRLLGDLTSPSAAVIKPPPLYTLHRTVTLHIAATDDNTGLAGFLLTAMPIRYNSDKARHVDPVVVGTNPTLSGKVGDTDCYFAQSVDNAGNVPTTQSNTMCTVHPVDDRSFKASHGWKRLTGKAFYRRTAMTTDRPGRTLKLGGAYYAQLALVVTTCKTCGKVRVMNGHIRLDTVSLTSNQRHNHVIIPVTLPPGPLTGTVKITTLSHKPVTIDGLGVSFEGE